MVFGRGKSDCKGAQPSSYRPSDGKLRRIAAKDFSIASGGHGYLEIDGNRFYGNDVVLRPGDSGGPWMYLPEGFDGPERLEHALDNGVVIGPFSAPNADWDPRSWPPTDYSAKSTSGPNATSYLEGRMGKDVLCVNSLPWNREAVWPWPWTWWEKQATIGEHAAVIVAATSFLY